MQNLCLSIFLGWDQPQHTDTKHTFSNQKSNVSIRRRYGIGFVKHHAQTILGSFSPMYQLWFNQVSMMQLIRLVRKHTETMLSWKPAGGNSQVDTEATTKQGSKLDTTGRSWGKITVGKKVWKPLYFWAKCISRNSMYIIIINMIIK